MSPMFPKCLKSIAIEGEVLNPASEAKRRMLLPHWNRLRVIDESCGELRMFAGKLYFEVLNHYNVHRRAMTLAVINRSHNKTLSTILKRFDAQGISMRDFVMGLVESGTVPFTLEIGPTNGIFILPGIVQFTILNRVMAGTMEDSSIAVGLGQAQGPVLSEKGMRIALDVFSDETAPNDEKIASAAKPVEAVHFPAPVSEQDAE